MLAPARIPWSCGLLILATLAAGCGGDPRRIRLTADNPEVQFARLRHRKGLSAEEKRLLYGYFARLRMESADRTPPNLAGHMVGELITRQRAWEMGNMEAIATGEQEISEWRLSADPALREMAATLAVRILGTEDPPDASPGDAGRAVIVRLELENISSRTIVEVEGAMKFTDVDGRDLFGGTIATRDPLEPLDIVERAFRIECVPFKDREVETRYVRLSATRPLWEPRMIRFESGGMLVTPKP